MNNIKELHDPGLLPNVAEERMRSLVISPNHIIYKIKTKPFSDKIKAYGNIVFFFMLDFDLQ